MLRSNCILHEESSVIITYSISYSNNEPLSIKIGVISDSKLHCLVHTEILRNKTTCDLRLIKRTCGSFGDYLSLYVTYTL